MDQRIPISINEQPQEIGPESFLEKMKRQHEEYAQDEEPKKGKKKPKRDKSRDVHRRNDEIEIIDIDQANSKAEKNSKQRQIQEQLFMQQNDKERLERITGNKIEHDLGVLRLSSIKTQPQESQLKEFKAKKQKKQPVRGTLSFSTVLPDFRSSQQISQKSIQLKNSFADPAEPSKFENDENWEGSSPPKKKKTKKPKLKASQLIAVEGDDANEKQQTDFVQPIPEEDAEPQSMPKLKKKKKKRVKSKDNIFAQSKESLLPYTPDYTEEMARAKTMTSYNHGLSSSHYPNLQKTSTLTSSVGNPFYASSTNIFENQAIRRNKSDTYEYTDNSSGALRAIQMHQSLAQNSTNVDLPSGDMFKKKKKKKKKKLKELSSPEAAYEPQNLNFFSKEVSRPSILSHQQEKISEPLFSQPRSRISKLKLDSSDNSWDKEDYL